MLSSVMEDSGAAAPTSTPPAPKPDDPAALGQVLDAAGAREPFAKMHLLAGALDRVNASQGEGVSAVAVVEADAWRRFARDLAADLLSAPPTALAGGGEPGPAHAEAIRIIERIATGQAIDPGGARNSLLSAAAEARRSARDSAEALEVRDEADRRRWREMMTDCLPVAVVAAVVITAETIKALAANVSGDGERLSALKAGLATGAEALAARHINAPAALDVLIADARNAKKAEAALPTGGRGADDLSR